MLLRVAVNLAARSRRLHPVHVLGVALALASVSFVLHGQWQVHSQLQAAQRELKDLKSLVTDGRHSQGGSSSSSSSSGSGRLAIAGGWHSRGGAHGGNCSNAPAVQQLVDLVRQQQLLLSSVPDLKHHRVQRDADELISRLLGNAAPVPRGGSSPPGGNSSAAARQGPGKAQGHPVHMDGSAAGAAAEPGSPFWRTVLQQQAARANASGAGTCGPPPGTLCLDMTQLLGLSKFMSGITWEPKTCFTGLAKVFPNITDQAALKQRLLGDLVAAAAAARGVQPDAIDTSAPWWGSLRGAPAAPQRSILSDPAFTRWQAGLVRVLTRYMVRTDNLYAAVPCAGAPWSDVRLAADDLPLPECANLTDAALVQGVGLYGQPFDPLATIANVVMVHGLCMVPTRDGHASYGDFMMARVMDSKWRTFETNSLEEDAVVFLWDILYQTREVFLKQRWLGVTAMQSPFDFMAIADIIHEVAPDVILETGTANGGSALMWASLLELNGLHNSSVITVDLATPGAPEAFGADATAGASLATATGQVVMRPNRRPQTNPVEHPLWKKYVTFVQGSSVEPGVVGRVKGLIAAKQHALQQQQEQEQQQRRRRRRQLLQQQHAPAASEPAAAHMDGADGTASSDGSRGRRRTPPPDAASPPAGTAPPPAAASAAPAAREVRVLVLLDSHHTAVHVLTEMEAYCSLVSPGSFCVVEDTKLTRWTNSDPGPLAAVRSFVAWHPEFRVDRQRELLFTHHPYGYLQRLF